jgi:ferredoxin
MPAKTLPLARLNEWLKAIQSNYRLFAPTADADGVVAFRPVDDPAAIVLAPGVTPEPMKSLFMPTSEVLFRYSYKGDKAVVAETEVDASPWVVFGARLCDAKAQAIVDVLWADREPDPYYKARRESATIVAMNCNEALPECFCESIVQALSAPEGADVVVTLLGDRYLLETHSEKGEALLQATAGLLQDTTEADIPAREEIVKRVGESQPRKVAVETVTEAIKAVYENAEFWKRLTRQCIGCGVCSFLCPTCTCFDVLDDAVGTSGYRYRCWDTCQFRSFCTEASGHDPKPEQWMKQRNRVGHKLWYSMERFGRISCTGCGRCIQGCPGNLDITKLVEEFSCVETSRS